MIWVVVLIWVVVVGWFWVVSPNWPSWSRSGSGLLFVITVTMLELASATMNLVGVG